MLKLNIINNAPLKDPAYTGGRKNGRRIKRSKEMLS